MPDPVPASRTTTLRLLQTTDLHMQLLPFDYVLDRPTAGRCLQGLEEPIRAARDGGPPCLLLDSGDFLQGSPLADALAEDPDEIHPMISAFNRLGYDALALGNHEFEYGLPFLTRTLAPSKAIVVSSNLRIGPVDPYVAPWTILTRTMTLSDGTLCPLRIGILGFTPPQVTDWSAAQLGGQLMSDDALTSAFTQLPRLRRAGAEIVVALCHGGPASGSSDDRMENPALALARLRGIDALLMGHLHQTFPGPAFADIEGVTSADATIRGTPAMMPGSHGSCLGQMDLDLSVDRTGNWRVTSHRVTLIPARVPDSAPDAAHAGSPRTDPPRGISENLARAHARTRSHLSEVICTTPVRITTYFADVGLDPSADLMARTQTDAIRDGLRDTPLAALPVLAATAPFRAGGHGGAGNFLEIAPGPLRQRDCHALAPFDNPVCGVLRRGWQIRQWLERSAAYFDTIRPGTRTGVLTTGAAAPYHFDTIHGLTYEIDLSREPCGATHDRPGRIRDVMLDGVPLEDDTPVVVAASSYRAHGGGGMVSARHGDIVFETAQGLRALLTEALSTGAVVPREAVRTWRFRPLADSAVVFPSAPAAADLMPPGVRLFAQAPTADDFALYQLDLAD